MISTVQVGYSVIQMQLHIVASLAKLLRELDSMNWPCNNIPD